MREEWQNCVKGLSDALPRHCLCDELSGVNMIRKHFLQMFIQKDKYLVIDLPQGQTKFHYIWLRDHCRCKQCYDHLTIQRLVNSPEIPLEISPQHVSASEDGLSVNVVWPDEHQSKYDLKFLANNSYWPPLNPESGAKIHSGNGKLDKVPWNVEFLKENLPQVEYSKVMDTSTDDGIAEWCLKIWKYGFCFVNNTPVDPESTKKLIERIAFIRPTHYGGFWDFTSDLSTHDNAYSDVAIPLHIDNTYFTDPAGLQLFHLLKHTGEGGITTLCDSLHAANILKQQNPEYYDILSKIPVPAHSAGEENVFIQPSHAKPIINHDNEGNVIQVRWNTSDRSVMNGLSFKNPETEVPLFYAAIKKWNDIIESKDNEFFHQLKPGQCLIFDNWRVFHSRRTSFTGERRMCGAYINHDDYVSRVKLLNLSRDDLLETL